LEPDETILTPISSPRVSYNPISTLVGRISSKLYGVIDGVSALASIEDTTGVVLPWLSIAADGEGSRLEGLVDGTLISSNRVDGVDVVLGSARRFHAVSVLSGVGIAAFGILSTLGFYPTKSLTRITSGASIIIGIAINDFLRGEGYDRLTSDQAGRFNGLGGGEGPARSALFLVLNGSGHSLCNPVDGTTRGLEVCLLGKVKGFFCLESEDGFEFFLAPVGKLGVAESGGAGVLVHFGNLVSGEDEVAETDVALVLGIGLIPES